MFQVTVIGSGSWGTAIGKLVATNVKKHSEFSNTVLMWVHDEAYEDSTISAHINQYHRNPRYLPSIDLPDNLIAITTLDLPLTDIFIFCLPHQFTSTIDRISSRKESAIGINLGKGLISEEDGKIYVISEYISQKYGIRTGSLSGPNIADQVARGVLTESTLCVPSGAEPETLRKLFASKTFRVETTSYRKGYEVCGAVKNVLSIAYGIVKGMGCTSNTLAMVFRKGMCEMRLLCDQLGASCDMLSSATLGDFFVSCCSGRNYRCGVEIGKRNISYEEYEKSLAGQKLQGPGTAAALVTWLKKKGDRSLMEDLSLICAVDLVCNRGKGKEVVIEALTRDKVPTECE